MVGLLFFTGTVGISLPAKSCNVFWLCICLFFAHNADTYVYTISYDCNAQRTNSLESEGGDRWIWLGNQELSPPLLHYPAACLSFLPSFLPSFVFPQPNLITIRSVSTRSWHMRRLSNMTISSLRAFAASTP